MQHFPDYMDSVIAGVSTLMLRFVPTTSHDPAKWSEGRFSMSREAHVHKFNFEFLERFPSVQSLGIITHWLHKIDASRLFSRISAATRHLRIKTLTTNVVPDRYPGFAWQKDPKRPIFPDLKEIMFDGCCPVSNRVHGRSRLVHKHSPYRGRPLSTESMTSLMEMEQKHGLKFNFRGLNIVLWVMDTESVYPANAHRYSPDALRPFHDWLKQAQADRILISVVQVDLFCPTNPEYRPLPLWWEHPDIYLDIRCCTGGFTDRHVEAFTTRLVPTTRSLFVSSFINPDHELCNCSPSRIQPRSLHQFFTQIAKRAPHFQLEHLQNFPPLDHDTGPFRATGMPGWKIFLDGRCFQPLSTLCSLTSLDLDFNYLFYGKSHSRRIAYHHRSLRSQYLLLPHTPETGRLRAMRCSNHVDS